MDGATYTDDTTLDDEYEQQRLDALPEELQELASSITLTNSRAYHRTLSDSSRKEPPSMDQDTIILEIDLSGDEDTIVVLMPEE